MTRACSRCGRRAIAADPSSGQWLCARCLSKIVRRRVKRAIPEEARRGLAAFGLENTASVVFLHIAKTLSLPLSIAYAGECPTLRWLARRLRIEEISEIPPEGLVAVPLSLEEASNLLLSLALELKLAALLSERAFFPLAGVPQEHLELYAAYKRLPVCPRRPLPPLGELVDSLFRELEETTPMARYQFLSSFEKLREIAAERVRKSRTP